jgi:hypothetical protein
MNVRRHFGGTFRLHLHVRRVSQAQNEHETGASFAFCLLQEGFFLALLRAVRWLSTASVVQWSKFLATDSEVQVRFPALPDFF